MPLNKQNLAIPFALGLDTKTDPWQVAPGRFLSLVNGVFNKGKMLQKRNGFKKLTALPSGANATIITTFQGGLTAIGDDLFSYAQSSDTWQDRGYIKPISLNVKSLVRTAYTNSAPDSAIGSMNQVCTVFKDGDGFYKYQVLAQTTGQTLVDITNLPATATQARVFALGNFFVMTFLATVSGTPHLQYIALPFNNLTNPSAATDLSTLVSSLTAGYDGYVVNNSLYVSWDGSDLGGAIRITYLSAHLAQGNTVVYPGRVMNLGSVTADLTGTTPVIWVSAYDDSVNTTYCLAVNQSLFPILAPTTLTSDQIQALTSTAYGGQLHLFWQVFNTYSFSSVRSDYVRTNTLTQGGGAGASTIVKRSVGIASKAFLLNGVSYFLAAFQSSFQPTYFLLDQSGHILSKLAYSNGAGYASTQVLPSISISGNVASMAYLLKDLLASVNKSQNAPSVNNIYSQTGVNLANFDLSNQSFVPVEIGNNLHIPGGLLWMYDGVKPVEHGFLVYPEDYKVIADAAVGSMTAQEYFYQVVYEWTDAQGNLHRSAPGIPTAITLTTSTSVRLDIPTLRLTYKIAPNSVRIVIYRWSTAQQNYYQITSILSPLINSTTVDSVSYIDSAADSAIIGNTLIYTTGGVIENIAAPASNIVTLFKNRLFLVNAEDPSQYWYSKQVIESVPVEMSDLFTLYVAPTTSLQSSSGDIAASSPMDDKLITFKNEAIYYHTGNGPDNTGANNDFSEPTFITATVGSSNQNSIVFVPSGLMFQSNKGIWLLGRNLSTGYVGAPVEQYNVNTVLSAISIPGTNQVRFTILNGQSSTLYLDLHTILSDSGEVLQETPSIYIDGHFGSMLMFDYYYEQWGTFVSDPGAVLMEFTTSWYNLAGVQGFQRAYWFDLIGNFLTPHFLNISIAHDYNPSPSQGLMIRPANYTGPYGDINYYGDSGPYGGPEALEQWRISFTRQKCQSFQITVKEVFNYSTGTDPGPGLTFSGLNLVIAGKKVYNTPAASNRVS